MRKRWWIAALLATATAINYLDRQNLPVAISEIQKAIPISNAQYSQLQFLFLLAYGAMYAVGGRLLDLLGVRWGYALMIAWWSAANALHGLVGTVTELGVVRFALGLGEGGGFPGSAKAVAEWFPAEERAFAFGVFNTGSSVGAVIAPPLIAAIVTSLGWRWVFLITGGLGFAWAALWVLFYRTPARSHASKAAPRLKWSALLGDPRVRGMCVAKFLGDSAWYFFIFWLPKYLADIRHLNIRQIGYYAWIPYALAGAGSLFGGWFSGYLIRGGWSVISSRKLCLGIAASLLPASLLITASPVALAIVFFSMAMFGHQFWSTIMQTLAADLFAPEAVGSVTGLVGASGSFGGMLFNLAVGAMLTAFDSYRPVFLVAGLLHPASVIVILLTRIAPREPQAHEGGDKLQAASN
jgi:ACS family hexuronate transporter-like MFS transporter